MARYGFKFWLNCDKDDELLLAEEIDQLKAQRKFSQAIREGLRLWSDLRKGNTDVLFELFPAIREKIIAKGDTSGSGGDDRMARLEGQIQTLERLLIAGNNTPLVALPTPHKAVIEPDFVLQKDTSDKAAKNLLGAMSGLM